MQLLNYWKPVVVSIIILYGSITSGDNLNKFSIFKIEHMDKIIHFCLYFALSITLLASLIRKSKLRILYHKIIVFIWVVSYGIIMEVFQFYFTQTRTAEILDILANTSGCILAILVYPLIKKYHLQKIL